MKSKVEIQTKSPWRPGDKVITPLGHRATIVAIRADGYLDAKYDDRHPILAEVILQPHDLKRAE